MTDPLDDMIRKLRETSGETKETAMEKIFQYFVSADGIRGKTKISPAKRNMIYVYDLMHKKRPAWGCDKAAENLAHLFISEDGESRKGMIELFRGVVSQLREESVTIEQSRENGNR